MSDAPDTGWAAAATPEANAPIPYMQADKGAPGDPAQPSTPATPATPSTPAATENPAPPSQIKPAEGPGDYQAPPLVLTPVKPKGIVGIMQPILDALTGRTRPELAKDQQGNTYMKQTSLTHGEQWSRLGAELVAGAAKGFAAGRGNNLGAAVGAGLDEGEKITQQRQQQQTDMSAEAQKQTMQNANNQMLQMQRADQAWKASNLKVKAGQEAMQFEQGQIDRLTKPQAQGGPGGKIIGTAEHMGDIGNILKVQPDVMQKMIQDHQVELKTNHDPDGNVMGITAILMPSGYRQQVVPSGATGHHWDSVQNKMQEFKYSDPQMQGDYDDNETAAGNAQLKYHNDQAEQAAKTAQTERETAQATLVPSEIRKNNAEANKALAEAAKAGELTKDSPEVAAIGESIAKGNQTEDQIPGFGKIKGQVQAYLAEHHPNLDQTSVVLNGGERKQRDLAGNSLHNVNTIDEILQRRPDLIGKMQGRLTQGATLTGTNDKDIASINEILDNFSLATTGTHGTKAQSAREDARTALLNGFKNGPAATHAAIGRARDSLTNLAQVGKPKGTDGNPYVYKSENSTQVTPPAAAPSVPPGKVPAYQGAKLVGYADDNKGTNYVQLGKP